jgi:hypothetical protein
MQAYSVTLTDAHGCTAVDAGVSLLVAHGNNGEIKEANQHLSPVLLENQPVGKNDLLLHPNPTTDITYFNFQRPLSMKLTVYILDIAGKQIEKLYFDKDTEHRLSFEQYTGGVYLIKVVSEDGQVFVKRLIVSK